MNSSLWIELRQAASRLRRTPALLSAAILSLGLGLGASAVVFETARQLLLARPALPRVEAVTRLSITQPATGLHSANWSYPAYLAVRDALAPDFQPIAYTAQPLHYTLQGEGGPRRVAAEFVSAGYFEALGIVPQRGRAIAPLDDAVGEGAQVVVLGDALWRDHFGASEVAIGQSVRIDGQSFSVIGVLPAGVHGLSERADLWMPMAAAPALTFANRLKGELSFWHAVFVAPDSAVGGRLDARLAAAAQAMTRTIDFRPAVGDAPVSLVAENWLSTRVDPVFAASFGLIAACVGLLLVLVASNLILLLLARVETRRGELAMRVALGAGRLRIVATLGYEILVIGAGGVMLSVAVAIAGAQALSRYGDMVKVGEFGLDRLQIGASTAAFAAALCVLVLLTALAGPARRALALSAGGALAARLDPPYAQARRRWFAGGQVFVATVLAVAAGFAALTVWNALALPLGFAPAQVLTARVSLPNATLPEDGVVGFLQRVQLQLGSQPGVDAVGVANCLPIRDGCDRVMLSIDGAAEAERAIAINMVGGDYFGAMSIPLLAGRWLDARDDAGTAPTVLLNANAVARYFGDRDPLGARISISAGWPEQETWARVVGVVGDTLGGELASTREPLLYLPIAQFNYGENYIVVRAAAGREAESMAPLLERTVRTTEAGIVAYDVATMDMRFGAMTARRELAGSLLAGLAGLAVLLAAAGVYAVFELLVQRRRREFGVRLALGANASALQRAVTREGVGIAAICAVSGALVAGAIAWKLGAQIPGIAFDSPLPYAGALLFTLGASALACWLPARSAARTEPMAALRHD